METPSLQPNLSQVQEQKDRIINIKNNIVLSITSLSNSEEKLDKLSKFQNAIIERADYLKRKYPNAVKYATFHYLIGSTPNMDSNTIYEDFPEEDSVEKFMTDLVERCK